jgi:hypothetical protein
VSPHGVTPQNNNTVRTEIIPLISCITERRDSRSCEHGHEHSGSIEGEEFLDSLSDYQILKKDWASLSHIASNLIKACCLTLAQLINYTVIYFVLFHIHKLPYVKRKIFSFFNRREVNEDKTYIKSIKLEYVYL